MKVLVTGGRSMLGRSVAAVLLARGDDVTVLQRNPSGLACREVLADIADRDAVLGAVRGQDAVVHLAAKVTVVGAWQDFVSANIEGTRNIVDAARRAGVPRVVHVSTPSVAHTGSALFGVGAGAADPERARGHYARSKAVAELIALGADSPDLAVVAIRPHLVWGPGDTQLVGGIIERAQAGRLALVGSGAALIDTTYVDNAADALVAALDRCGDAHGRALVVSNGEPRPVAELVTMICLAAGAPPPRRHVPAALAWAGGAVVEGIWSAAYGLGRDRLARHPMGEPPITRFLANQLATAHWFDQRETRSALAWSPRVSLDEGMARLAGAHAAR